MKVVRVLIFNYIVNIYDRSCVLTTSISFSNVSKYSINLTGLVIATITLAIFNAIITTVRNSPLVVHKKPLRRICLAEFNNLIYGHLSGRHSSGQAIHESGLNRDPQW